MSNRNVTELVSREALCVNLTTVYHEDEKATMRFLPFTHDYAVGGNYWSVSKACLHQITSLCGFLATDTRTYSDRIAMQARVMEKSSN